MRGRFRSALAVLVLAFLLVGAGSLFAGGESEEVIQTGEEEQTQQGLASEFEQLEPINREEGWQKGSHGGTFVVSEFGSQPKTFNTVVAKETSSTNVTNRLYAGAFRRNQFTLEWENWAAESYEISNDEKTITVTLREGMKWSDGEPVTAEDWVRAVNEIYMNEKVKTSTRNALVIGGEPTKWEQVDRLTFRVTFPKKYAGIFNTLTLQPLPMHILGPVMEEGGAEAVNSHWGVDTDVTEVVGNGPFTIASYEPGQRVTLEPNPHYFEQDQWGQQLPYLDQVIYVYVKSQDTQLQRFLAGDLDFYAMRGEDYSVLKDKDSPDFTMYTVGRDSGTEFITFNQNPKSDDGKGIADPKHQWMSNQTFRKAMAHLVDRQTIIDNIAFGFGYPQYSFVWRESPYYWDGAEEMALKYSLEKAREKLDSIDYVDQDGDGWREDPNGNKIAFQLNTNSGNRVREAIGELFAQEASKVGIDVTFRPINFNSLVGKLTSSYDWDSILIGLTGSVDPISGANVYPSSGNLHMIEPSQETPQREWEKEVDEAWAKANFTTDEEQRQEGYKELQQLWIENVPWVYTYNAAVLYAYTNDWGNLKPQPVDGYGAYGILHRVYKQQ
jgi:peptide/nickel transport system substrate-binding protein